MENVRHRTQISLEDWQYQALLEMSIKTKRSLSAIIRDLITEKLNKQSMDKGSDPITSLIGIGSGDGLPVAREHDKHLYGKTR